MTPASAGSPKGRDTVGGSIAEGDNIAVREADATETIALTQSQQAILNGLSGTQRQAILRAVPGGRIISTGEPAFFEAWAHNRTLNKLRSLGLLHCYLLTADGLAIREALLRTTLLQANRNGK